MRLHHCVYVLFSLSVLACGDDPEPKVVKTAPEPVTPPEVAERKLPTLGGPDGDFGEAPPEQPVDSDPGVYRDVMGKPECCMVTFSLRDDTLEDVERARLRGDLAPLDSGEGVTLTRTGDVWSAEVCVSPLYQGSYYYEFGLTPDMGDELYIATRHNPFVSFEESTAGTVNLWSPAEDCASLDASIHSKTSE